MAEVWPSPIFRQKIVSNINEALALANLSTKGTELENYAFIKAKTKEEYFEILDRIIQHTKNAQNQNRRQQQQHNPTIPNPVPEELFPKLRQDAITKITHEIASANINLPMNAMQMENYAFSKASTSTGEYLKLVAQIIIDIRVKKEKRLQKIRQQQQQQNRDDNSNRAGPSRMPDSINVFHNQTRQGIIQQAKPNVLESLIHRAAAQQQIPSEQTIQNTIQQLLGNMEPNVMNESISVTPLSLPINTPGHSVAVPNLSIPLKPHEEQQYHEKFKQLSKYIEPLKCMVACVGNDGKDSEKLLKMNKLLEILCNPNKRISFDTLLKCEIALKKIDLKIHSFSPTEHQIGNVKKHVISNPLLEAVAANFQSPIGNHTLLRTFRPCVEDLFGLDINNFPPNRNLLSPSKKQNVSTSDTAASSTSINIPHLLQGEIARLDQKFIVSLDPLSQNGTKLIKLVCCLDSHHLPDVPPISVDIPDDYPYVVPSCKLSEEEYNATPFLMVVQAAWVCRIRKLPKLFSLTHLLDTWEMSVRQACSPALNSQNYATKTSVLLGI